MQSFCYEQKSYPRSKLFQAYESENQQQKTHDEQGAGINKQGVLQETHMISISVQELFDVASNVQKQDQKDVIINFDNEEELDFDISNLNY